MAKVVRDGSAAEKHDRPEMADFLSLTNSVEVPPDKRGLPWDELVRRARAARAAQHR